MLLRRVNFLRLILLLATLGAVGGQPPALGQEIAIESGFGWLRNKQGADGSWGSGPADLTTPFHTTAIVVDTFHSYDITDATYLRGVEWVSKQDVMSIDYLSRKAEAMSKAGMNASREIVQLVSAQNSDGGWGIAEGFSSEILDTALAVKAIATAGHLGQVLENGVTYLLGVRNPDGGYGLLPREDSRIYYTSLVILALREYKYATGSTRAFNTIRGASAWLLGQQHEDGGWGEGLDILPSSTVFESSLSTLALRRAGYAFNKTMSSSYLLAAQNQDGSWNSNAYETALALVALQALSANVPPQLVPIGDKAIIEGARLNLTISASDPDGDIITLSASGLSPFATFRDNGDGTGRLVLQPGLNDSGIYQGVRITASDGNLTDSLSFTIRVRDLGTATPAGGPLILMGIDAEDCGPGGHGPIETYVDIVNSILAMVTNGGSGILVMGGDQFCIWPFWIAVGEATGQPVTFAGGENISTQSFEGFAMIGVASDGVNTIGGLTSEENTLLAGRSSDVASFVNSGGGLLGFSNCALENPFLYLGGIGGFECFGLEFTGLGENITPTNEGLDIGVTDALDVCCWHELYLTFPPFLSVLATYAGEGYVAAIGGVRVVVPGFVLSPATARGILGTPHSLAINVTQTVGGVTSAVPNVLVDFRVTGANTVSGSCTTGEDGLCTFTYTGTTIGLDTIAATAVVAGQSKTATVTMTWIAVPCEASPAFEDLPGSFTVDISTTLTFVVQASDTEAYNTVTLGIVGAPAGASFSTTSPSNPVSSSFTWTPGPQQAGTFTINFTATDQCGLLTFHSVMIVVRDIIPPVLTPPLPIVVGATGPSGATVTYTVTATDNTGGTVNLSCNPPSGSVFPVGVTTVTCTATDSTGNSATKSFTVTVQAGPPPPPWILSVLLVAIPFFLIFWLRRRRKKVTETVLTQNRDTIMSTG